MVVKVSLLSGAVASDGVLSIQTNGTTEAISISTGQVATFVNNPILTGGTINGVAYLNTSKILTTGTGLVFDGTNFGVGTSTFATGSKFAVQTASGKFDVASYGGSSIQIQSTASFGYTVPSTIYDHIWFQSTTELMRLNGAGNLGLGVTPVASVYTSSANLFEGQATVLTGRKTINFTSLNTNAYEYPTTSAGTFINSASAALNYVQYNGQHQWQVSTNSPSANTTITWNTAMTLDASGNLLVGDTSAYGSSRLSVKTGNNNGTTHAWYAKNSSATVLGYQRDDGLFNTGAATNSPYNFTTASAANLFVDASGTIYRSTSSLKYKTEVQDAAHGLSKVMALRSVTYKGKNDGDTVFGGLIAEEVHAAGLTEFVEYAEDGTPDALAYGNMVSLCIKAIQELKAEFDAYKAAHP